MNCADVRSNIAAYLDGEIDGAPRQALDAHFAACADCHAERVAQAAAWRLLDDWTVSDDLGGDPDAFVRAVVERAAREPRPAGRILGMPRPWAAAAAAVLVAALGGSLMLQGEGDPPVTPGPDANGGTEPAETASAEVPADLLRNLEIIEAFDALAGDDGLDDADLELLDRLSDLSDEDLEILGG